MTDEALKYVNKEFDEWNLTNKGIWDVLYEDND
jgi:hypothetical protein